MTSAANALATATAGHTGSVSLPSASPIGTTQRRQPAKTKGINRTKMEDIVQLHINAQKRKHGIDNVPMVMSITGQFPIFPMKKRSITRFTPEQTQILLDCYQNVNRWPTKQMRRELAERFGVSDRKIQIWFQVRCALSYVCRVQLSLSTPPLDSVHAILLFSDVPPWGCGLRCCW